MYIPWYFCIIDLISKTPQYQIYLHYITIQSNQFPKQIGVKNMYFYKFLLYLVRSELVGVVKMLELWTWYEKVTKDNVASAYVLCPLELPLSQFRRGQIRRLKVDERD